MITKPRQRSLAAKELLVDNYAQRTYQESKAQKIAENWDQRKLGVFKVSERSSGVYYVLDGQHRLGALRSLDRLDEVVEALVYKGLTIPEEAFLFLADNADGTKPTPVDIFRLSVVAEDPSSVEISATVKEHGLTVGYGGGHHVIAAVASLRWIYEHGGTDLLSRVLTIVEQAWPPHREAKDGQLIKGLANFLSKADGPVDVDALIRKLGAEGTSTQLLGQARTFKPVTGRALWVEISHRIAAIYNKGRTRNRVAL